MSLVLNPVTSKCWELKLFKFRSLNIKIRMIIWGFPGVLVVKNPSVSVGDMGLIPESRRSPGRGNGNPLQFFPGKSYGQRSLAGYSPWGLKQSDTIEHTCIHVSTPS